MSETDEGTEKDVDTTNAPAKADAPDVKMLPPMVVLLFVSAGIILDWLFPFNWGHMWGGLGLILFIAAVICAKWSINVMKAAGTNVPPNQPATVIVSEGPFQFSRNPIYLSFLVAYAGLAMMADAPVMLLLIPALYFALERMAIVPEEAYLEEKFGDEYLGYKNSVRRWV